MNHTHLMGYLVADIEEKTVNETSLCKFTLVSRQGEKSLFLPVEVWKQSHLPKYLQKGSRVLVSGYLKQENWQGREGEKRSRVVLVGHSVDFLDIGSANEADSSDRASGTRGGRKSA